MTVRAVLLLFYRHRLDISQCLVYLCLGLYLTALTVFIFSQNFYSQSLTRLHSALRLFFFTQTVSVIGLSLSLVVITGDWPWPTAILLFFICLTLQIQFQISKESQLTRKAFPPIKSQLIAMRHWLIAFIGVILLIGLNAVGTVLLTKAARFVSSEALKNILLWLRAPIALYFCSVIFEFLRPYLLRLQLLARAVSSGMVFKTVSEIASFHHLQLQKLYFISLENYGFNSIQGQKGQIFITESLVQKLKPQEYEFLVVSSLLDSKLHLEKQRLVHYTIFSIALFLPYFLLGQTLNYWLPAFWAVPLWKFLYFCLFMAQQFLKKGIDQLQFAMKSRRAASLVGLSDSEVLATYNKVNDLNGFRKSSPVIFGLPTAPLFPTGLLKREIKESHNLSTLGFRFTESAKKAIALTLFLFLTTLFILTPKYELRLAAAQGNLSRLREVLKNGLSPDSIDILSNITPTPLLAAADQGRESVVSFLLEAGADPNKKVPVNFSPLVLAVMAGKLNMVKDLISHGARVNFRGVKGYTALMWAARLREVEIARYLILSGASLDSKSDHHSTALMISIQVPENSAMTKLLISKGADVRPSDLDGDSALKMAKRKNLKAEIQWLEISLGEEKERQPASQ